MRISFDLDGVITSGQAHEFFVEMEESYPSSMWPAMKQNFYISCKLRCSPYSLMNNGDNGFIITARKPESKKLTLDWLHERGILLPVHFADPLGEIDWHDYPKASIKAAHLKAGVIMRFGIEKHYDNNPYIVATLREILPQVTCVFVEDNESEGEVKNGDKLRGYSNASI